MKKLVILGLVAGLLSLFYLFDGGQYIQPSFYRELYQTNPQATIGLYFFIYVFMAALSVPGAALMTLVGGAVFGLWTGLLIVSFASTIGATCAFIIARLILRDWVQNKFGAYLTTINKGIEKEGAFYLFSLRLIPAIPFFAVNLAMALTPMRAITFYWVSQVGMLVGTAVYVNAGVELGNIKELSPAGIMTPGLFISFLLLAVFPFVARNVLNRFKQKQLYRAFVKPKKFDANMVVIGAGAAGLVSSYIAAAVKAKVILIEKHKMGGDCLNTGCVPSKALIKSAKVKHQSEQLEKYGLSGGEVQTQFPQVMQRVQDIIRKIEPHDSVERYSELGVDCLQGTATIISPYEVEVDGKRITTKNIVIASGARPWVPEIPGLDQINYLTSDTVWDLTELPKHMLVIGAGPIGCELAQSFARLGSKASGSKVTVIDMASRVLPREDDEVSELVHQALIEDGVEFVLGASIKGFESGPEQKQIVLEQGTEQDGQTLKISFDQVLFAVGRKANTEGMGLESLGIELNSNGTLAVNEYLQTQYQNIYACGDVAGPYQFTHMAAHQAWYVAVNALFGRFKKFKVDYSVVPHATFVDPEVARVGLNETEAKEKNITYEITRYGIDDLDRAIADSHDYGFVKVLTVPGKDKILGVTIVAVNASDMIGEYVLAMRHGLGLNKILGTIHIYPTMNEANKYAAGEWKRAHAPEKLLTWVEKFHRKQLK